MRKTTIVEIILGVLGLIFIPYNIIISIVLWAIVVTMDVIVERIDMTREGGGLMRNITPTNKVNVEISKQPVVFNKKNKPKDSDSGKKFKKELDKAVEEYNSKNEGR